MANQGKQLKEMVRLDRRDAQDIAKKMGYAREHLYILYKQTAFTPTQLANIAKAGFRFNNIPITPPLQANLRKDAVKLLDRISELEEETSAVKDDLRALNKKFNELVKSLSTKPKGSKIPQSQRDLFSQQ